MFRHDALDSMHKRVSQVQKVQLVGRGAEYGGDQEVELYRRHQRTQDIELTPKMFFPFSAFPKKRS